jgi:hypothetical protein
MMWNKIAAVAMIALVILSLELSAQDINTEKDKMSKLLPDISIYPGWKISESPRYYKAEPSDPSALDPILKGAGAAALPSLWEYIDGAADIYYTYGFILLQLNRYQLSANQDSEITIEIYMMKDPLNAFGIYSAEKKGVNQFIEIPVEGYYIKDFLAFWHGRFYVKLSSYGIADTGGGLLRKLAADISSRITDKTQAPKEMNLLPPLPGSRENAVYVPSELLGLGIIGDGFLTEAAFNETTYKIFIKALDSQKQAAELFEKIFSYILKTGTKEQTPDGWEDGSIRIVTGSRIGNIILMRKNTVVAGVIEFENLTEALKTAEIVYKNLK